MTQPATRFPQQLVNARTKQAYDLDISGAGCPKCGFQLYNAEFLERIPHPDSWDKTSRAECESCGYVYTVRLEVEDNQPAQQPTVPPGVSWFGAMRR
ncbi:MAG: hypothetical protein ACYC3X_31220 [Pirellulaceae bacterium]